jgi:3-isopropylmalate/(R)-2-methylmalate dehydratase large subunit
MAQTLYEKVFDRHVVRQLPSGQAQLLMGLHLLHEVTSPQAFAMLRERNLKVMFPDRTFATVDHIVPTHTKLRPFEDAMAEEMLQSLEKSVRDFGIRFFSPAANENGVVHIIGPERGLTQPGMTICCGDSHTATHGAFGALAFGIGTSQIRDVLATQTLAMEKLKVRRIDVDGKLRPGVYAKDVILYIIQKLGVNGGVGFAYEYAGEVFARMTMDERMTVCNMSIEGGARCGYVNPDQTTYAYLKGREYAPKGAAWDRALAYWESIKSDPDAKYDDLVRFKAEDIAPIVTWGITPAQSAAIDQAVPAAEAFAPSQRDSVREAYAYMDLVPGQPIEGIKIDVAFIGSCTNGRLSDFEEVVKALKAGKFKVQPKVRALVVPGSVAVRNEMVARGWDKVFADAGF